MARNYRIAERKRLEDPLDVPTIRACESLTLVALLMYFTAGNIVYTNFAMVMALSYLCRRCAQRSAGEVPGETGLAGGAAA